MTTGQTRHLNIRGTDRSRRITTRPSSFITSPSRKIDPATTIRGLEPPRGLECRARRCPRRRTAAPASAVATIAGERLRIGGPRVRRTREDDRAHVRDEARQDARDVLVAHRREDQRPGCAAVGEEGGERRCARTDCAPRRAGASRPSPSRTRSSRPGQRPPPALGDGARAARQPRPRRDARGPGRRRRRCRPDAARRAPIRARP